MEFPTQVTTKETDIKTDNETSVEQGFIFEKWEKSIRTKAETLQTKHGDLLYQKKDGYTYIVICFTNKGRKYGK